MNKLPIALQVYSIRDDAAADFEGAMRRVKEMGYDGVELAGLYNLESAVAAKEILDKVGLKFASAHVPVDALEQDAVLDDYAAAGLKYIAIPWMTAPKDADELAACIEKIRAIGQRCKARGMQLMYHNHDFEFTKINDQYILDAYYAGVSPDYLQTELDTCWVNVGGESPVKYINKYAGRAPVVHLKDFVGSKSQNMYALIGADSHKEVAQEQFEFRPVGYGKQDFYNILAAAAEAGAEWLVVEQDRATMEKTPMESAELSINYLKTL